MERSMFLPLPDELVLGQLELTETQLTVEVISTQSFARCPGFGDLSDLSIVSTSERSMTFRAESVAWFYDCVCASFFCWTATCPRKVFAERLPELARPWARVGNRLLEELKAIGLAASIEFQSAKRTIYWCIPD